MHREEQSKRACSRRAGVREEYSIGTDGKSKTKVLRGWPYEDTGVSAGSFARRHHLNSWLISVISIPGITINLQLSISRDSSSSGNWQETRQYWQS